ncbi:DUF2760 domain-containing protein [Marinomonas sp. M1K-6]|uniref:DUF2760 domain-containing protein n=1 Tax=Marinomonas profundi TaxID=2726122 RepID=A0A847RBK5_9GAMM|nr:DUF2760 domain-containing protein [Marinomonas profundi]NLQ18637.1 DUF2760 domain-containing protein [Marinomonas profundi]UDV02870.1 DUF2760 domain-containing protein [Marinomonas profundi]
MTNKITPVSFVPRLFGAFGQFFKYMASGDYAARCQAAAQGEQFAFEVEPKIITEEVEVIREIEVAAPVLDTVNADGAHQLLQLLQQEARFIDFIQESIDDYSDADVGAASRQIHAGCAKVLQQHFTIDVVSLDVVNTAAENSRVEVPSGYDAKQIKLEGRVKGDGPYAGTLIHPGWKVTETRLPKVTNTESLHILAPAEVEV